MDKSKIMAGALDNLTCGNCGHTHKLTHQWLEMVSDEHNKGDRIWYIDEKTYQRLICSKCGKREIKLTKYPTTGEYNGSGNLCQVCNGTGGYSQCWKCSGSGYD